MKTAKLFSAFALAATIGTISTVPAYAATSTGSTTVTYTAGTSSPDGADWMVSYPTKVVLSDMNISSTFNKAKSESMDFKIFDKLAGPSTPYTGSDKVKVQVNDLDIITNTLDVGNVKIAFANDKGADLTSASNTLTELDQTTLNSSGSVYVKDASAAVSGADYSGTINFTFNAN